MGKECKVKNYKPGVPPGNSIPAGGRQINSAARQPVSLQGLYIQALSYIRLVIHTQIVSTFRYSPVRWHIHSSGCLIPASGNRNNSTGALNNFGTNGYAWSASPFSTATNGYNLNFNSSTVNPENNNNRSNGFPVRCVAAFVSSFYRVAINGYGKKVRSGPPYTAEEAWGRGHIAVVPTITQPMLFPYHGQVWRMDKVFDLRTYKLNRLFCCKSVVYFGY